MQAQHESRAVEAASLRAGQVSRAAAVRKLLLLSAAHPGASGHALQTLATFRSKSSDGDDGDDGERSCSWLLPADAADAVLFAVAQRRGLAVSASADSASAAAAEATGATGEARAASSRSVAEPLGRTSPAGWRAALHSALRRRDYPAAVRALHAYHAYAYGGGVLGGSAVSGEATPLGLLLAPDRAEGGAPAFYTDVAAGGVWGRAREVLVSAFSAPALGGAALGRLLHQYPLLHGAGIELFFGHVASAAAALAEAARTAQANGDAAAHAIAVHLQDQLTLSLASASLLQRSPHTPLLAPAGAAGASEALLRPSLQHEQAVLRAQLASLSRLYVAASRTGMWRQQAWAALQLAEVNGRMGAAVVQAAIRSLSLPSSLAAGQLGTADAAGGVSSQGRLPLLLCGAAPPVRDWLSLDPRVSLRAGGGGAGLAVPVAADAFLALPPPLATALARRLLLGTLVGDEDDDGIGGSASGAGAAAAAADGASAGGIIAAPEAIGSAAPSAASWLVADAADSIRASAAADFADSASMAAVAVVPTPSAAEQLSVPLASATMAQALFGPSVGGAASAAARLAARIAAASGGGSASADAASHAFLPATAVASHSASLAVAAARRAQAIASEARAAAAGGAGPGAQQQQSGRGREGVDAAGYAAPQAGNPLLWSTPVPLTPAEIAAAHAAGHASRERQWRWRAQMEADTAAVLRGIGNGASGDGDAAVAPAPLSPVAPAAAAFAALADTSRLCGDVASLCAATFAAAAAPAQAPGAPAGPGGVGAPGPALGAARTNSFGSSLGLGLGPRLRVGTAVGGGLGQLVSALCALPPHAPQPQRRLDAALQRPSDESARAPSQAEATPRQQLEASAKTPAHGPSGALSCACVAAAAAEAAAKLARDAVLPLAALLLSRDSPALQQLLSDGHQSSQRQHSGSALASSGTMHQLLAGAAVTDDGGDADYHDTDDDETRSGASRRSRSLLTDVQAAERCLALVALSTGPAASASQLLFALRWALEVGLLAGWLRKDEMLAAMAAAAAVTAAAATTSAAAVPGAPVAGEIEATGASIGSSEPAAAAAAAWAQTLVGTRVDGRCFGRAAPALSGAVSRLVAQLSDATATAEAGVHTSPRVPISSICSLRQRLAQAEAEVADEAATAAPPRHRNWFGGGAASWGGPLADRSGSLQHVA